jgi:hypothetical protein
MALGRLKRAINCPIGKLVGRYFSIEGIPVRCSRLSPRLAWGKRTGGRRGQSFVTESRRPFHFSGFSRIRSPAR